MNSQSSGPQPLWQTSGAHAPPQVNYALTTPSSLSRGTQIYARATRHGISMSAGKNLSYWSTGNGDDTMVTIWNPADEEQTFIFRLIFAGGHYDDLMTLGPRATAMFDISDIIRSAGADAEGNIIPAGTQEGSAKIIGIEADNQHILLTADSGIYNVSKATCYVPCYTCDGAVTYTVPPNPFDVVINGQQQESLIAQWNDGSQYDYTTEATWSSNNTSVATVQAGLVQGVSAGSVTISGYVNTEPIYVANVCGDPILCPILSSGGASASGTVQVPTALRVVQTTYIGAPNTPACPPGYSGWKRVATRAVVDQHGQDIKVGDQLIPETVTPNAGEDGLYMAGHIATHTGDTDSNGQYPDTFSVCSTACPGSATTTATQTNSDQLPSGGSYPLTNSTITYACTYIKINGALTP